MDMLNLQDLSRLMNEPVHHDTTFPFVHTNISSDIPKFEGNNGEDTSDHVTNFHLWFSSNSINNDCIHLRMFQCIVMGVG
jgi:hypothetical protein